MLITLVYAKIPEVHHLSCALPDTTSVRAGYHARQNKCHDVPSQPVHSYDICYYVGQMLKEPSLFLSRPTDVAVCKFHLDR